MTTDKPEVIKALVPLSRITEDHDIQIRGEINSAVVKDYEAIVRETGGMDPIDIWHEGELDRETTVFRTCDGFHRMAAYRAAGMTRIHAYVRRMTKSEAIELALRRNGRHGAPMSKAQKRAATEIAVKDARIGEFADAKIARIVGVSQSLVNLVRRGISPEAATERVNESNTKRATKKTNPRFAGFGERQAASTSAQSSQPPTPDPTPTKSRLLNQLFSHISSGLLDEIDVVKTLNTPAGSYVFLPNPGSEMNLVITGKNGKTQYQGTVTVKDITFEEIYVKEVPGERVG